MISEICNPYEHDIKLLNKLGLPVWQSKLNEEIYIGEVFPVIKENGKSISIKIWVTCMPAQFYRFIVHNTEQDIYCEVSTGSGSLVKYYPMALSIADGTLVVKQLFN